MPKGGPVKQWASGSRAGGSVTVVNTVTPGLAAWNREAQKALTEQMARTCNTLRNSMNRRLKWRTGKGQPGGRATGQLARSIVYNVRSSPHRIEGEVGAGVHYAKYVEGWNSRGEHKPIERHFVSFERHPELLKWALRHGIKAYRTWSGRGTTRYQKGSGRLLELGGQSLVFKIRGLMVGGPDFPSPFMQPALEEEQPRFMTRFAAALERTMHG